MKQWLASREPRERRALLLGLIAVVAVVLYAGVWQPLNREVGRLQSAVTRQQADLAWMKRAAAEVGKLRANQSRRPAADSGQSLLALVDASSRGAHLDKVIRRLEPQGTDQVQVWIEGAGFDALARWLVGLQAQSGVEVTLASMEQKGVGTVDARLTLARPGFAQP